MHHVVLFVMLRAREHACTRVSLLTNENSTIPIFANHHHVYANLVQVCLMHLHFCVTSFTVALHSSLCYVHMPNLVITHIQAVEHSLMACIALSCASMSWCVCL